MGKQMNTVMISRRVKKYKLFKHEIKAFQRTLGLVLL